MEKKYDERNKVNYLDGKAWIRNAVNYWEVEDQEELEKRMIDFCFKKRVSGQIYSNLMSSQTPEKIEYDLTISKIKSENEINKAINRMIYSAYNSYHFLIMKNEVEKDILLSKYCVDLCERNGLEYRGKIIVKYKEKDDYIILQLFLNRLEEKSFNKIDNVGKYKINATKKKQYFIYSKSKMDKIGLKHPAPYSYNDIEEMCKKENIRKSTILDPFLGVGSTIIGTYKNNNYNIGIELNSEYVNLIQDRFKLLGIDEELKNNYEIINGDSLKNIKTINKQIDYVITSPPYFNILKNKNKGVRHDNTQSRQGVEFYSNSDADIGNLNEYSSYIRTMKKLFKNIKEKTKENSKIYIVISDFTVDKKEKDVHSDYIEFMNDLGYKYVGTSYIIQNQKSIYPFGYPYKIVLNHIYQYIIKFEV